VNLELHQKEKVRSILLQALYLVGDWVLITLGIVIYLLVLKVFIYHNNLHIFNLHMIIYNHTVIIHHFLIMVCHISLKCIIHLSCILFLKYIMPRESS
ncbi:hypothetical protein Gogos_020080, partial [Gossypium gossypioides]|nr:hypothetical protein [Gossypium gossypioides]